MPEHPPDAKRKDPFLALVVGWLAPGAAHFYAGRRDKAIVFSLLICATFLLGLSMTRMRGVFFFGPDPNVRGLAAIARLRNARMAAQLMNGLPALAASVGTRMAGITNDPTEKTRPRYYILGLYTIWITGLLNLLVAVDGCLEAGGLKERPKPVDIGTKTR